MISGVLVAESLRSGSTIEGLPLAIRKIDRVAAVSTTPDQPSHWTLIEFNLDDAYAGDLADILASTLDERGWYADFRSGSETFVVFPGRVFRYQRGDEAGRSLAKAYARTLRIPESQLDWPE